MNMYRIILTCFFKPIQQTDIITAVFRILSCIMVNIYNVYIKQVFIICNNLFCFINTFYSYISVWCRTNIINPNFHNLPYFTLSLLNLLLSRSREVKKNSFPLKRYLLSYPDSFYCFICAFYTTSNIVNPLFKINLFSF